jgi:hypothetical protein
MLCLNDQRREGDMRAPSPEYQLAELNVMHLVAPLDEPVMADFVALLAPINALADQSPGFVWRLETEDGDSTAVRVYDDDQVIVNFSVWRSQQELWDFAYASQHLDVMRRRRQWASHVPAMSYALWWIRAGELPTLEDAMARLERVRTLGPTPLAFTFRESFPPPDVLRLGSGGGSHASNRDGVALREPTAGSGASPRPRSSPSLVDAPLA